MRLKVKNWKTIPLSFITTLIVTGCSVVPQPWETSEIKEASRQELMVLNEIKEIAKPVSLNDAIYRGITNNRQKRVKMMETALSEKQFDLLQYEMLPSLTTNAGYSARDNYAASASAVFEDGTPSGLDDPTYSISQSKQQTTAGITFSWNVLDFGLSYVKAKQQSDRFLISKEEERKVIFNITQEIRRAYYQAVTAEKLLNSIRPLMNEVKVALQDSDRVRKLRLKSPLESLTYQRELLDVLRDLMILEKTLISSKLELSELMGLKPGTKFELEEKVQNSYFVPSVPFSLPTMEKIALENRPEILESRYKERISEKELSAVMLSMLPGVSFDAGYSYNDSEYLLNSNWYSLGANVTWNLFNVFKYGAMSDNAEAKKLLEKERKLAISLAVITQVHLSSIRYQQASDEYELSKKYLEVSQGIYDQAVNANQLDMNSDLVFIKEKLSHLLATLRHSAAYANMQNSYGRMYASMGINKDSDVEYQQDNTLNGINEPVLEPSKETVIRNDFQALDKKQEVIEEVDMTNDTQVLDKTQEVIEESTVSTLSGYINDKIYSDNADPFHTFELSHIVIKAGESLNLNGAEYIVQNGDTISDLSITLDESIDDIIKNNFWLVDQGRVTFK